MKRPIQSIHNNEVDSNNSMQHIKMAGVTPYNDSVKLIEDRDLYDLEKNDIHEQNRMIIGMEDDFDTHYLYNSHSVNINEIGECNAYQ